jgi:ankyrin repeat protein
MRRLACGLLILAALALPAAAQARDQAPGQPPGNALLVRPIKEAWPTLEAARIARCDDSEWLQAVAEIKAADPEQDADKQTATGDFSLKSSVRAQTFASSWFLVSDGTIVVPRSASGVVRCKLPDVQVQAFPILHRANNRIASTWCGRVALVLAADYTDKFNMRVVGHQAYPHKDVCFAVPVGGSQTPGNISERPTPDMIPAQVLDIATAARFGLTERVATFIADGADVGQRDMFGFDALKWSVVRDYRAVFDLLVAAGGSPDFCEALKAAVEFNRVEPVAPLAQRCTSGKRLELLEPAVKRGKLEIVKPLIDTGPALQLADANEATSALSVAVWAGRIDLARLLLDRISPAQWQTSQQGLLNASVRMQNANMMKLLLERGADPSTGLQLAARLKAREIMRELVRVLAARGADLNAALPWQPQKLAAADVQFDPLGRQSPGNDRLSRLVDPPIFDALHPLMDFKMLDLLLELGASPNVRDGSGRTPLMIAITHSQIYGKKGGASWIERFVPQRLLEGQEDWAHRGVEPVRVLLAKGADVSLADHGGLTALHHAARSDYGVEIAHILLKHGADINARDASGKTALDHALDAGLSRMPEMLAAAGGQRESR